MIVYSVNVYGNTDESEGNLLMLQPTLKTCLKNVLLLSLAALVLGTAAPKASADGVVIPAYLPLTDATSWNILKENAATFTRGTSTVYKDYFVVVTGPLSGPFTNATDWATAASVWGPIVVQNGEIFGYVHTLAQPSGSAKFRTLAAVKADVSAWVNGYGHLSGIFIDEFMPRYEITDSNAYPTPATFPNGQSLAPTDRSFVKADGTINTSVQVIPAGGYYSQLIGWIRGHYPGLRIITNPGGKVYSNQTQYVGLANITCTFENTYAYAANSPVNNWANLNLQANTASYIQAALIHTNTNDLSGAINQSIAHGYKYFYTTSLDPNVVNAWGTLPPYFSSEISLIANYP